MEDEYPEVNPLSEISPLYNSLYGCNNLDIISAGEEKSNNESNSFIDRKDESKSDYKFSDSSTAENENEMSNTSYSELENPLSSGDDDSALTSFFNDEDSDNFNIGLISDINNENIQNKNKIIEDEINDLGEKIVYNVNMKKTDFNNLTKENKDKLLEIVKKQNSIMVICSSCNSCVPKEEVASLIHTNDPLCKICLSKYDIKNYKDYADKSPAIFSRKCSHCNSSKILWRQIKICKTKDKIKWKQCNYCALKKQIQDKLKKSEKELKKCIKKYLPKFNKL